MTMCRVCTAHATDAYLCKGCEADLGNFVRRAGVARRDEIGRREACLLDELDTALSRQSHMWTSLRGIRSAESVLPFNVDAAKVYNQIAVCLCKYAVMCGIRQDKSTTLAEIGSAGAPRACAQWLSTNLYARVVKDPVCVRLLWELRILVPQAETAIDRPPDQWYAGQCKAAVRRTADNPDGVCTNDIYANAASAVIQCSECKTTHDIQARRALLLAAVDDVLATATEIARAVHLHQTPLTAAMIWKWAHRGRLVKRAKTAAGDPLYRMGDVLALARDAVARQRESRPGDLCVSPSGR